MPDGCGTETVPRPPTTPTCDTVPAPTASTGWPGRPARSTPRCPAPHLVAGRTKGRSTVGRGESGQAHDHAGRRRVGVTPAPGRGPAPPTTAPPGGCGRAAPAGGPATAGATAGG